MNPSRDDLLSGLEPLQRFSDRAADYVRYRPDYPAAAIDAIVEGQGDPAKLVAADVGAGTGISSRQLADRGVRVIAVEPNAGMRAAAAAHPGVEWRVGAGEATGLEAASVDLVLVAQAFHWFRHETSLAEFHRILRPRGRLAIMWNRRGRDDPATMAYIEAVHAVNGESVVERMDIDMGVVGASGRFTPAEMTSFPHFQRVDLAAFIGRATSASYVPKEGESFERLKGMLTDAFARHREADGLLTMRYATEVWRAERL